MIYGAAAPQGFEDADGAAAPQGFEDVESSSPQGSADADVDASC